MSARRAEAAAAERQAEAGSERARALWEVVEALDAEAAATRDAPERARLLNESRLTLREAELVESETRRFVAERDRALGQAKSAEVKRDMLAGFDR